jgi:two-component system sensor histidine kinase BaeS
MKQKLKKQLAKLLERIREGVWYNIRIYFTLVVMGEMILTVFASIVLTNILRHVLHWELSIPESLWVLMLSAVLGTAFASFVNKKVFSQITELSQSMGRVAAGDFGIRLETKSKISEIRKAYHSFNVMARELAATEILQTDFVSSVSHEIKTPINAIEGYTTLLQNGQLTESEREQYVEKILFNTRRLSQLVGNILLLSKVDNQVIPEKCTRYRLDEQIRQSIVLLEPKWAAKEQEFEVEMEPVLYGGYESLMLHVWNNLLDNAIKFNPTGGKIQIGLIQAGKNVRFTIQDSGPGIDPAAQTHIFDRFYQGDSSHRGEGNGLGLALVKRILDLCGGAIQVENCPPRGCRFTVMLPDEGETIKKE